MNDKDRSTIRTTAQEINEFIQKYHSLGKKILSHLKSRTGELKGLRRASGLMLKMFIDEIDIMTPEKLRIIRKVRRLLK